MKTAVLSLIAAGALACGGADHAVTTTDPTGHTPTMNETAGRAPELVDAPPARTSGFDPHDNSGFAGIKTESMSPVAASTRSTAQTQPAPPRGPAAAAPAPAGPAENAPSASAAHAQQP